MVKEATATVFVFGLVEGRYCLGLVFHPRLGVWIPPGGHVEPDETAAEAALREVTEETGLTAALLPPPHEKLPDGYPHTPVSPPWWTVEIAVGPDRHTPADHVHVDHQYVALAASSVPAETDHPFVWRTEADLSEPDAIIADARGQARALFGRLPELMLSQPGWPAGNRHF
ncbi:NUDIX domain-containing protein [Cryptosporangium aurantiacum]|uniref:NUDIX domain-containing protein n=1 Tax=Cryptosporangium aurantiacum TaxID=134849 RepID=UPI000A06014E|nr:NUDIX domain-containing protein [Cryptosporangium aurantiacum]